MKRVKNYIKKIGKNISTVYAILILIIIGLIVYIFVDNNYNSKTTTYSQIKVNNDLGDSIACKSNAIRNDTTNIVIKFCGAGEVTILDSSNASTTTAETGTTATEDDATATESDTTIPDGDTTVTENDTSKTSTSLS